VVTVLTGVREPIVVILLLIAFFTSISGKPLDGLLMLVAGVCLAWDTGRRSRQGGQAEIGPADVDPTEIGPADVGPAEIGRAENNPADTDPAEIGRTDVGLAGSGQADVGQATGRAAADRTVLGRATTPDMATGETAPAAVPRVQRARTAAGKGTPQTAARRRRRPLALAWLAGGALYVVVVGSFSHYSWPATVPVVGLGAAVVVTGWRGPHHSRPGPAKLPTAGLALWGLVLVAGCLWELSSLLEQPTLTTSSYAHPTISTLTDPVLSTWAGRSIVLAAWLVLGWFLVER
jgi:hypothetical protein